MANIGGIIKGIVTRLVAGVGGAVDRVFFTPSSDASHVDGAHRTGAGEIIAEAEHKGLEVGKEAAFQLVKEGERAVVKLAAAVKTEAERLEERLAGGGATSPVMPWGSGPRPETDPPKPPQT